MAAAAVVAQVMMHAPPPAPPAAAAQGGAGAGAGAAGAAQSSSGADFLNGITLYQMVDVFDIHGTPCWRKAQVICIRAPYEFMIHYEGWEDKWDEWIHRDSRRLARAGTHTSDEKDTGAPSRNQFALIAATGLTTDWKKFRENGTAYDLFFRLPAVKQEPSVGTGIIFSAPTTPYHHAEDSKIEAEVCTAPSSPSITRNFSTASSSPSSISYTPLSRQPSRSLSHSRSDSFCSLDDDDCEYLPAHKLVISTRCNSLLRLARDMTIPVLSLGLTNSQLATLPAAASLMRRKEEASTITPQLLATSLNNTHIPPYILPETSSQATSILHTHEHTGSSLLGKRTFTESFIHHNHNIIPTTSTSSSNATHEPMSPPPESQRTRMRTNDGTMSSSPRIHESESSHESDMMQTMTSVGAWIKGTVLTRVTSLGRRISRRHTEPATTTTSSSTATNTTSSTPSHHATPDDIMYHESKLDLASHSPPFLSRRTSLLSPYDTVNVPVIELPGFTSTMGIKLLLEYLYCGNIRIYPMKDGVHASLQDVFELVMVAARFNLDRLIGLCALILNRMVTVENVMHALQMAVDITHNLTQDPFPDPNHEQQKQGIAIMQQVCMEFIVQHWELCFRSTENARILQLLPSHAFSSIMAALPLKDFAANGALRTVRLPIVEPSPCTLVSCFKSLYETRSESTCDFSIRVQGHVIWAHRRVLACRSEYFRALLRVDCAEREQNQITYQDDQHTKESVEALLKFLYYGDVHLSREAALALFSCTDFFGLSDSLLENVCVQVLTEEDCTTALVMAHKLGHSAVFRRACKLLDWKALHSLMSEEQCDPKLIMAIVAEKAGYGIPISNHAAPAPIVAASQHPLTAVLSQVEDEMEEMEEIQEGGDHEEEEEEEEQAEQEEEEEGEEQEENPIPELFDMSDGEGEGEQDIME